MQFQEIPQLRDFVKGLGKASLRLEDLEDKYIFINRIVRRFKYNSLSRKDKRLILIYLRRLTGYKKAQLHRLIKRALRGYLKRIKYVRHNPHIIYSKQDIKLLETTDALHRRLNSVATKEILIRESKLFGNHQYSHIAQVSASHIKPEANGKPGSIRVDTVHQRDIYHINSVCEITQWEVMACVPLISERYLKPALKRLLDQFPFVIFNFHSDRGSEFINQVVAGLLNKLLIEQTKSRSRHTNDNALVESKNASTYRDCP